jgi:SPP1 family phage portal protein
VADKAITHAVAFGFWNLDHVEVFSLLEFVPLYDEDNGALMAGIRYWQIDPDKPLRATLYEIDGYTEYIWRKSKGEVYLPKRPYVVKYVESPADGREIYDGENYPTFPIVPMWGCPEKQSKLVGLKEQIDCYDLIKSGYANNVDEASMIYWTIKNAGGMDDVDLAQFIDRMRTVHAATMDDDAEAQANSIDVPVEAREKLLDRLERDLYRDARALDVERIASGAVTATQILAAYSDINSLCDEFEYCVQDFVYGILDLAGIDDDVTFTRSQIINTNESINTLVMAAQYLPEDYITTKILTLLGDGDKAEDVLRQMAADETYVANPPEEGELNEAEE